MGLNISVIQRKSLSMLAVRIATGDVHLVRAAITGSIIHYPKIRDLEQQPQGCSHPTDANGNRVAGAMSTQHWKQATHCEPEKTPEYLEEAFLALVTAHSGAATMKSRGKAAEAQHMRQASVPGHLAHSVLNV